MRPLTSSSILPSQGAPAIQTKAGKVESLRLYIPPKDSFHQQYHSITADLRGVLLVNDPGEAHLKVFTTPLDDRLTFVHMDKRVTPHGMSLVKDGVESDPIIVGGILESAAHYFRELNRTAASHDLADLIKMEFYEVDVPMIRIPPFPNFKHNGRLQSVGSNPFGEKIIDFVAESAKPRYGFKIMNTSKEDLYVYAFYFDNTNFGIVPCYTTSGEHSKLESPLKANGELRVGYESVRWRPLVYQVREGQDLNVGFLKIYLLTQPVDLSGIQQQPAFLETRTATPWYPQPQDSWVTILIPIIPSRNPVRRGDTE